MTSEAHSNDKQYGRRISGKWIKCLVVKLFYRYEITKEFKKQHLKL